MNRYLFAALLCLIPLGVSAQQCTQAQLNTEFLTDPTARAYAACAGAGGLTGPNVNDQCVLQKFNAPCTAAACKVDNVLSNVDMMQTIIDSTELDTLANSTNPNDAGKKQQLSWLLELPSYNMAKASFQQKWKNVFGNSSPTTKAAIEAAQQKDAARSQIVCGRPGTLQDISCGLRGACL